MIFHGLPHKNGWGWWIHLALRAVAVHPSGVRIETGDLTAVNNRNGLTT
jgi:hypothetical protein